MLLDVSQNGSNFIISVQLCDTAYEYIKIIPRLSLLKFVTTKLNYVPIFCLQVICDILYDSEKVSMKTF